MDEMNGNNNVENIKSQFNSYQILKDISSEDSNNGFSFKVKNLNDNQFYRMNRFKLDELNEKILSKIATITLLESKYIVNYIESFVDEDSKTFIIITDFYTDTLYNNIIMRYSNINQQIPENDILTYIFHISNALSQLHKSKIYNINLNSKNIYIDKEKNLKLNPYSDITSEDTYNNNDNPIVCPELIDEKGKYSEKSDIWYLGLLIYEICCLKKMKRKHIEDLDMMYKFIIKSEYEPIPSIYSRDIYYIIKKCLQYYKKKRPFTSDIVKKIMQLKGSKLIDKRVELFKMKKNYEKNCYLSIKNCEDYNKNLGKFQNYKIKSKKDNSKNKTPKKNNLINIRSKTPLNIRNINKNIINDKNKSFTYLNNCTENNNEIDSKDKIIQDINNGMKICNFEASHFISQFNINKYRQEELGFYNKRIECPLLKFPNLSNKLKRNYSVNNYKLNNKYI